MSKRNRTRKKRIPDWLPPTLVAVAAVVIIVLVICLSRTDAPAVPEPAQPQPSHSLRVENAQQTQINLGYGMYLVDVAKYTGIYMEDGTDEVVSGVMMIVVENTGDTDIQYAEIELPVGRETAVFTLTNLPAGERVVLLERNRMDYQPDVSYTTAISQNVILFRTPMELCDDRFEIRGGNGVLSVTNISGEDISEPVVIYYKNSSEDMLYGGITYRVMLSAGLRSGETAQLVAGHFSTSGSRIVHVTCGETP